MVRPAVEQTVGSLRRALTSAGVTPDGIRTVVLVGGSARIPLVAEVLGRELGRPVAVSPQPKHAVALGAALLAGGVAPRSPRHSGPPPDPVSHGGKPEKQGKQNGSDRSGSGPPPTIPTPPDDAAGAARRRALFVVGLAVAALLLAFATPAALRPSPGAPVGLLAGDVDVGIRPVVDQGFDGRSS